MSELAIVGAEQKSNDFYRSAEELFSSKFNPTTTSPSTFESIKKRTKIIVNCCTAQIVRVSPSEPIAENYSQVATAPYNEVKVKALSDDVGPPSKYKIEYLELSNHPKLLMTLDSSSSWPSVEQNSKPCSDLDSSADKLSKAEDLIADHASQSVGPCKVKGACV